jgi:glycosyltransferase involved in cell wall biosynthesis
MISAVIPVYNGELYLAEAISSALNQTSPVAEIIVIDDGSQDRTAEVVKQFDGKVRYYRQPRAGAGAARNLGVEKAAGDLIAFLDADDLWLPEKTALQLALLSADETCEAVFGGVEEFFSPELNMRRRRRGEMEARATFPALCCCANSPLSAPARLSRTSEWGNLLSGTAAPRSKACAPATFLKS